MTAISAPSRPERIDRPIAADLEVVRLRERLRGLRRRPGRPGPRPTAAPADLRRVEGLSEEAPGELRVARPEARGLARGDWRRGLAPAA